VKDLVVDDLRIDMTVTPDTLRLDWQGSSRVQSPRELLPFLDQVAHDVLARKASIDLHFEQVAYFNSTTMVAIIRFLNDICNRSIGVRISYDPQSRLQRVFAETLQMFDRKDGLFLLQPV
jgi:hypothetical protein